MSALTLLENKINAKSAKIGVVGLGYVGLPLAHAFARKGFSVVGIDIDPKKVSAINRGKSFIGDLASKDLLDVVTRKKLYATVDYSTIKKLDAVIVCVPTPLNRYKDPDISFIISVAEKIKQNIHRGMLIVLESTTYPGTTDEVVLPIFEKTGMKAGRDFFLCFSPERIDPGNEKFKTMDIPKVVGGVTLNCSKPAALLYGAITPSVVMVSSSRTAEMAKLLENTFRIVNIGLINELAKAAENLKVDIWEAIDAAKTKPFGFMPFYPGPGIGGHCIGIDPIYLSWKARLHGSDLHFIDLARRVNAEMPHHVVSQSVYALNKHAGKAIRNSRILVLGVSYKKNVDDMRESPALEIIAELIKLGADVSYYDPHVPKIDHGNHKLTSKQYSRDLFRKQDLVILATDHSDFNLKEIVKSSKLIYDTRNAFKAIKSPKIVRL